MVVNVDKESVDLLDLAFKNLPDYFKFTHSPFPT